MGQGCILSPTLFNMYAEFVLRSANLDNSDIGVKIGGRNINNLRYTDDTTLLVESKKGLEELIQIVKNKSEKVGLSLNIKKTNILTTATNTIKIRIDSEEIETVNDFIFLGSKIDHNGESEPEIKRRIALGRGVMTSTNKIWKNKDISLRTKCRLVNVIVFPITTYACEAWTMRKAERIDAFELWCWRRLLRIPWTDRFTNKEILDRIKPNVSLEPKITKQRLSYFGDVMRANSLETSIMLGRVSGKRGSGRQQARWLDAVKIDTNTSMAELKEAVRDRNVWRTMIHRVTKSRPRVNG